MKVRVKFFASYREIVGQSDMVLELKDGTTVQMLVDCLKNRYERLGSPGSNPCTRSNRPSASASTRLARTPTGMPSLLLRVTGTA
ncbi:MAG: MoaD/ThiS family protein, partial [Methanomassiliicoccales archaeon]|nr:MoaD/ThiS family protein [Methanomassiliicoccales archaeon]